MRRFNKDEELPNLEERLQELMPVRKTETTESATLTAFVRRASLFRVGLSLATIWCVNDYFYIAGSMNVENLAGDMFVNLCNRLVTSSLCGGGTHMLSLSCITTVILGY